ACDFTMSDLFDFDLLCIGSGPAGHRAAVQAAKLRKRAVVIERRQCAGGVCVELGTIPSKTFREAVLSTVASNHPFLQPADTRNRHRPSAGDLFSRVNLVRNREVEIVEAQLWRNNIELMLGEASFKDAHTLVITSENETKTVTAENILIAVGTTAAPPPGIDVDGEIILTSDEMVHLTHLPRRLVVIGGGVIGIEYASLFAALEIDVTVVDKRERLLEFLDNEIVEELLHQLRNRNVTFRLGETVEKLEVAEGSPRQAVIHLESGKRIVSDMVLFSAGRIGATVKLNLEGAGLKADDRGRITVDQHFRTEVPHIYAAGDVIGYPSLAATSAAQGRRAACHAFGINAGPMDQRFPFGIYSIPEISMIGAHEHELTAKKIPYETGVARYKEIARGQILGDDSGLFKMLFHRETRELLGVHAIGTGATELIHIGQAVLELGGGLDYFIDHVFNYPTLAECYKVAALNAHNKLSQ
ncbi:MAG: Si-specific NAD(P)(+) transhydrogenase, partial [Nitrospirota bacterium]